MNNWQQFLEQYGARWVSDNTADEHQSRGWVSSFGESPADYNDLGSSLCDLGNLGIISAQGPDCQKFLQGQATCDLLTLNPGSSTPGAICNAKGRMLTYFQAYVTDEEQVLLSMDKTLTQACLENLEKYAAFFKTSLVDSSEEYRQFGLSGATVEKTLVELFPAIPPVNTFVSNGQGSMLGCPSTGLYTIICKADHAQALWAQLAPDLPPVGLPWWQLQLIRAGQASLTSALSEQLVPQMLNLQATGAISFSKGCYTGQEVVARMQYLGKLKRRTYLLTAYPGTISVPAAGTEITDADGKLVGTVVQAAPSAADSFDMLAVLRESALEQSELLISGQAMPITFKDLPYELAEQ